ncbi:MAG: response regulator [Rhodospirillales bacterium]|nr:response regulator [Rhodospirillales bacterium]MDE2200352.1 response regulator [Rhodospirillales bacterium]MDE2573733.1 response regulator [Rhodospirillales bacterium]
MEENRSQVRDEAYWGGGVRQMNAMRPREVAVVDDDTAVLDSFRFVLEMAGFTVATYSSAQDYLARDGDTPRCLILDQHMPVMTGLELTARLRARGNLVPILLITSAPSPSIVAQAAEIGIERVLEKPPNEQELIGFVSACGGAG